jgi:hypothetical protein
LNKQKPETEIAALLKPVDDKTLAAALQAAKDNALAFETALAPANQEIEKLEKLVTAGDKDARRDMSATKMRFNGARYEAEARLNQIVATFYELQVRKANISAERHHKRSGKFFFGMLAAQAAVIVSTFAIAAHRSAVSFGPSPPWRASRPSSSPFTCICGCDAAGTRPETHSKHNLFQGITSGQYLGTNHSASANNSTTSGVPTRRKSENR